MKQQLKQQYRILEQQKTHKLRGGDISFANHNDISPYYQDLLGNHGVLKRYGSQIIRAKFSVTRAGDIYEREADRVADAIIRMKDPLTGRRGRTGEPGPLHTVNSSVNDIGLPHRLPAVIQEVLKTPGRPLDLHVREFMEPRFGHDFSHITIHDDHRSAESAKAINALAYTTGNDIVIGSGGFGAATSHGRRLIAHELTHTLQQQKGTSGVTVQRDVIDDIRDKLSYGIIDWAITDADAMEALALLGTIPVADLATAINNLGSRYMTRLLENLPDSARSGEIYQRVIEAMGTTGVTSFISGQISYGMFDWAVTDAEVDRIFNVFINLPYASREQFFVDLMDSANLDRLFANANRGHHALYIRPWIASLSRGNLTPRQRMILRMIVSETSDILETLVMATEMRFDVDAGPSNSPGLIGINWEPQNLQEVYLTLDELPDVHVLGNSFFDRLAQFREAPGSASIRTGRYTPTIREVAVNTESGDPRGTVIHETGHAVDRLIHWSDNREYEDPARGGWKKYGANYNSCATEMVDDSNSTVKGLPVAQRNGVISEMADAMDNRSAEDLEDNIRGLPWFSTLSDELKSSVPRDRAIRAVRTGLREPWFSTGDGGEHLGTHVYQEGYEDRWVRYEHQARARKVSLYQFRDPGEWFAEAYRFYYLPDPRGRGAKLDEKDHNTKIWFDTNVHVFRPTP